MKRETGYYWVKMLDGWVTGIYYPESDTWWLAGWDYPFHESQFIQVYEKRIWNPDEYIFAENKIRGTFTENIKSIYDETNNRKNS